MHIYNGIYFQFKLKENTNIITLLKIILLLFIKKTKLHAYLNNNKKILVENFRGEICQYYYECSSIFHGFKYMPPT